MRHRFLTLLVMATFLLAWSVAIPSTSMSQRADAGSTPGSETIDLGSTPEATQEAGGGDREANPNVPRFGMVAVGDHPTGYFNDIEVAPGASVSLTVAIINVGTVPVSLHTYKVNALSAPNGGFASGKEADPPVGSTAWIDYPSFDLELAPDTQRDVTFTVAVPADAAPGQYIAGLVAAEADPSPMSGSDMLTQTRGYVISVGILVPGDLIPSFELGEPAVEGGFLTIPITNTGNYLVRPTGQLMLTDADGAQVHASTVTMGSVYAGLSTVIQVPLPQQMAPGDYHLSLSLTDESSGASASISEAEVTVAAPTEPGALVVTVNIEPNADPIAFANVTVTLDNGGQQVGAANVDLKVFRDGAEVETYPLATNQVVGTGETSITGRYIPATDWVSGTYTFQVIVSAVTREGEGATVIATIDVEDEIVIP